MLTTLMIGNKIAEARKKINISQAQLARCLFISSQAVGKWERGESMPDIITFNRLAEILGVDLNYFSKEMQTAATKSEKNTSGIEPFESNIKQTEIKKKNLWDMSHGNWMDADFSGLKNLNEKFSSSNMLNCLFIGSDMSGLILKSNNVESCDFSNSDLSNSHIQNSNFANNLLKECSMQETEFSGSYLMGCDFSGTDLTGALFKDGGFQGNPIANSVLNRTSFNGMQIVDIIFNSKIENCSFENCVFKRVIFQNTTLINTFFKNKNLKGIRFVDCQADRMTYEFLKNGKADLAGITLITQKVEN